MKNFLPTFVFSLLAGIFFSLWLTTLIKLHSCNKSIQTFSQDTIIITQPDTVFVYIYKNVPKPYKVIVNDSFPKNIDTATILDTYYNKYLAVRFYSDTLKDSTLTAIIDEMICENEMKSRDFKYRLNKPLNTIINNPAPIYYSKGFYAGLLSNYYDNKVGFGVSGGYLTRKGYFIGADFDVVHLAPGIRVMKLLK